MEKDLFGNNINIKIEEKISFNFKKDQFDEDFLCLIDIENIIQNVNKIVKGSLEEICKEKKITKKDVEIKANVKKGSFILEILVPYVIPMLSDPVSINSIQILFDWLKITFDKLKERNTNDLPAMHNKNINKGTGNIVNNYYLHCTINNYDGSRHITFSNEEDKENILENLKIDSDEEVKREKHIGSVIQANKKEESKDIFQPKNSKQKIKIEFPSLSKSEKIDIFNEDEIMLIGDTYYKNEKITKIVVIEILDLPLNLGF